MTNEKRLIDINYALKQLEIGELENGGSFSTDSSHIKDFLEVLPNVDAVEVVHGRWRYPRDAYICSVCKEKAHSFKEGLREITYLSDYCPNCGAKMDGGK